MIRLSKNLDFALNELKKASAETFYHSLRVKTLVIELLRRTNDCNITDYSQSKIDAICKGTLLHDIGKLHVDNFILTKNAGLTREEKNTIKEHVNHSFNIVKGELEEDEYDIVTGICLYHHERIDGEGYKGIIDVPFYVQAVSICDAFDSLHSDRIYRDKFSAEKAMEMIRNGECGKFDGKLVDIMQDVSQFITGEKW